MQKRPTIEQIAAELELLLVSKPLLLKIFKEYVRTNDTYESRKFYDMTMAQFRDRQLTDAQLWAAALTQAIVSKNI